MSEVVLAVAIEEQGSNGYQQNEQVIVLSMAEEFPSAR
jgi:hypothetical protein